MFMYIHMIPYDMVGYEMILWGNFQQAMFAYQRVGSISSILVPPNTSNGGPEGREGPELDAGPSSAYVRCMGKARSQ